VQTEQYNPNTHTEIATVLIRSKLTQRSQYQSMQIPRQAAIAKSRSAKWEFNFQEICKHKIIKYLRSLIISPHSCCVRPASDYGAPSGPDPPSAYQPSPLCTISVMSITLRHTFFGDRPFSLGLITSSAFNSQYSANQRFQLG